MLVYLTDNRGNIMSRYDVLLDRLPVEGASILRTLNELPYLEPFEGALHTLPGADRT